MVEDEETENVREEDRSRRSIEGSCASRNCSLSEGFFFYTTCIYLSFVRIDTNVQDPGLSLTSAAICVGCPTLAARPPDKLQ